MFISMRISMSKLDLLKSLYFGYLVEMLALLLRNNICKDIVCWILLKGKEKEGNILVILSNPNCVPNSYNDMYELC